QLSTATLSISITSSLFLFTATPPTATYTLSLHDALPIYDTTAIQPEARGNRPRSAEPDRRSAGPRGIVNTHGIVRIEHDAMSVRSEEHTSELQSLRHLVCRLLLEKKKPKGLYCLYSSRRY